MGSRKEDHFFAHVMYESGDEELEFRGFKEAIEHFNQPSEQ